jgi:hypothetical protein
MRQGPVRAFLRWQATEVTGQPISRAVRAFRFSEKSNRRERQDTG